jgi:glycosyltransferase involved in cell wall biosynthesis
MKSIKKPTTPAKRPFMSLCVIFRNNEDTIQPLLESVHGLFDEYVFTDTGCTDGTRGLIESFGASTESDVKITDFEWCDDFAAARNANFKAATGKWRMFLDSDDVLVHGDNLRELIERTEKNHPGVEGLFVPYDYDVLEELPTMRLVKWSKYWSWTDAIHERLVCSEDLPPNALAAIEQKTSVHVRHRRKDPAQRDAALRRNGLIAAREYNRTDVATDYKARLARTIAMELKLDGKLDEAEPYLLEVATNYGHLPEGRQAYADLSRYKASKGDLDQALKYASMAGPSYEAIVQHAKGDLKATIAAASKASVVGQQTTHEGFLFERVFAPMCMADAGWKLGLHPTAVEQVMNDVRGDLRSHEAVRSATEEIRKSINRITILVPNTPQPFDGGSTGEMLGGSEEAVVYLARELSYQGRNVRVFGVLPPLTIPGIDPDGVEYRPFSDFNVDDEHGTVVVWRAAGLVRHLLETQIRRIQARRAGQEGSFPPAGIGNSSLWLHDMSVGFHPDEAGAILKGVSSVVVLSDHHQRCIEAGLPEKHNVKFVKLSNGVVREDFEGRDLTKDPNKVVYTSCPSRGLRVLLDKWPEIKAACPKAYLDIYYDWSMLKNAQPELHADIVKRLQAVEHLDVKHHGGVGHEELYEAMASASVWAYSHFENTDVETFCISAVKATALQCQVVTAPFGALPEVAPEATFISDPGLYAAAVIEALNNPEPEEVLAGKAKRILDRFDWNPVATRFGALWTVVK